MLFFHYGRDANRSPLMLLMLLLLLLLLLMLLTHFEWIDDSTTMATLLFTPKNCYCSTNLLLW
jgi:hypothetical protein